MFVMRVLKMSTSTLKKTTKLKANICQMDEKLRWPIPSQIRYIITKEVVNIGDNMGENVIGGGGGGGGFIGTGIIGENERKKEEERLNEERENKEKGYSIQTTPVFVVNSDDEDIDIN